MRLHLSYVPLASGVESVHGLCISMDTGMKLGVIMISVKEREKDDRDPVE